MLKLFSDQPTPPPTRRAGFTMDAASKPLSELLTIASAASRSRTTISFVGVKAKPLEDLVRIAAAGGDCVSFVNEVAPPPADPEEDRSSKRERWRLFSRSPDD
jgi:hypothetical protein